MKTKYKLLKHVVVDDNQFVRVLPVLQMEERVSWSGERQTVRVHWNLKGCVENIHTEQYWF